MEFGDPTLILFGKLALACLLGMIIGTERAMAGKLAGTRTFGLIALGSCLLVLVSNAGNSAYLGVVNFDPMRMASAIVTAAGFLGAGLVIFRGGHLHGLTTATGMWVAAGVGVAVGFGMYTISIFTTVLTVLVFTVVWFIENQFRGYFSRYEKVEISHLPNEGPNID